MKKLAREKTQYEFEGNELSESIQSRLQSSRKQIDLSYAGLSTGINRLLEKDDRLLDGLQSLLPTLEETGQGDKTSTEIERLCQSLTKYSTQEIRSRIDATYSAAIASSNMSNGIDKGEEDKDRLETLRAELNELCSEIDGIAGMVVENQYRVPITHTLTTNQEQLEAEKTIWTTYLRDTLEYLTIRLEVLDEHIKHLHAHRSAITHASSTFDSITASSIHTSPEKAKISPAKQFQTRLKPLRVTQVQGNSHNADAQDPSTALLRHLEINKATLADADNVQARLQQTTQERYARLQDLERSTERTISDQVAEALGRADRDVGDLMQALHLHASYGQVRLSNAETQALIDGLEDKTQELGHAMRGLNVDSIADEALRSLQKSLR